MSNVLFKIDSWPSTRVNVMIATEGRTSMKPVHGIVTNHHLHDMQRRTSWQLDGNASRAATVLTE